MSSSGQLDVGLVEERERPGAAARLAGFPGAKSIHPSSQFISRLHSYQSPYTLRRPPKSAEMAQSTPSIDRLLNLVPDSPDTVLSQLQAHSGLASKQDAHGYSLLHAAASYGHITLMRALVNNYHVDPNIKDEDGETALFSVEEVDMAKVLIELGTNMDIPNDEGHTAAEKLADEDEQPAVAAYLREAGGQTNGHSSTVPSSSLANGASDGLAPPPPLPAGLQLNVGTMAAGDVGEEPDPEFRRRIEELAARGDFEGEEGQRELRDLVVEALSGVTNEVQAPPASRRRLD